MRTLSCTLGLSLIFGLVAGCQRSEKIEAAPEPTPAVKATNEAKPGTATGTPAVLKAPESPAAKPQPTPPAPSLSTTTNDVAVIKTTAGEMVVEFWPDVAPNTVDNFKKLARQGFYDGTCFHRVMKNFMIQGGDPKSKDAKLESEWGTGDPGYKIKAEFNDRKHVRGVISMARGGDPLEGQGLPPRPEFANSAGCQFFLCHGEASFLDGKYTAFGKLMKGDDVLEKIANTPVTASASGEPSKPTVRVEVQSIKIVPANTLQ